MAGTSADDDAQPPADALSENPYLALFVPASLLPSRSDIHDPTSPAYKKARRKHLKSTRNRPDSPLDAHRTPFRAAEKKYKARFPPPDLSDVLDLAAADPARAQEVARGKCNGRADAIPCEEILLRGEEGQAHQRRAYMFPGTPGLVLLPSYVSRADQRRLVRWALSDHAKHPNETNLDTHYVIPREGLWNQYLNVRKGELEDIEVLPRAAVLHQSNPYPAETLPEPPGPRKLIANEPASPTNYSKLVSTPKPPAPPSPSDTLMAHVDRSELSATSPLVSISLGCAAVFLIGGLTREDPPTPILLRSGDVVIMSGPACRRAYHSVPRILEGILPPHMEGSDGEGEDARDWEVYEEYLRGTRININVRQVFPKGFDPAAGSQRAAP
ncbi:hypothetical protein BN946_scf185004.g35 [Trametes cinnabarina]|uniref:Fe2OG dioxygenase domain-containing protein n=1 Tax=Pycnoporus cinnabarinus TaxID=5643 RepID=A0A060SKJ2_PYCCI|nr:hypothetical protein BN946_scf185004.g35 [Trametes cinnabarina]